MDGLSGVRKPLMDTSRCTQDLGGNCALFTAACILHCTCCYVDLHYIYIYEGFSLFLL